MLCLPVLPARANTDIPHMELRVSLDPAKRTLVASAVLDVRGNQYAFRLAPGLIVTQLEVDGRSQTLGMASSEAIHLAWPESGPHHLRLEYSGSLSPLPDLDHRQVLGRLPPMADPQGSFLPAGSGWYPDPGTPFSYRLRLDLPGGQKGIAPGTLVMEREDTPAPAKGKRKANQSAPRYRAEYLFDQATEGIDLMAGPYTVNERMVPRPGLPPLRLRTWFYPDMADLAEGYLDDSARYIQRYSRLIGPYPFDAFSVVAAPMPTGFGMPSLTYLGRDVLRLPFIRATSLGHEVLHNWWGNGVIPDWDTGNWSEGLTTFLADYAYREDGSKEAARDVRLGWLRNLAAVPEAQDMPLTAFTARHHGISSIIGYDKAAMVFFMLRDEIGADTFHQGLRLFWQRHRFKRAGWRDLEQAFGEAAGRDLGDFFRQWVDRAGAPHIRVPDSRWAPGSLMLTLEQDGPPYALKVPLRLLVYPDQVEPRRVDLKDLHQRIPVAAARLVQAVDLDPDYRIWRRLDPQIFPPILREVFVAPRTGLVVADESEEVNKAAAELAQRVLDAPATRLVVTGNTLPGRDPVLIVGRTERLAPLLQGLGLPPTPPQVGDKGTAWVWTGRDGSGRTYAIVSGRDAESIQALLRPLPHYGRQSWMVFDGAKALDKGVWPPRTERTRVEVQTYSGLATPGK